MTATDPLVAQAVQADLNYLFSLAAQGMMKPQTWQATAQLRSKIDSMGIDSLTAVEAAYLMSLIADAKVMMLRNGMRAAMDML